MSSLYTNYGSVDFRFCILLHWSPWGIRLNSCMYMRVLLYGFSDLSMETSTYDQEEPGVEALRPRRRKVQPRLDRPATKRVFYILKPNTVLLKNTWIHLPCCFFHKSVSMSVSATPAWVLRYWIRKEVTGIPHHYLLMFLHSILLVSYTSMFLLKHIISTESNNIVQTGSNRLSLPCSSCMYKVWRTLKYTFSTESTAAATRREKSSKKQFPG